MGDPRDLWNVYNGYGKVIDVFIPFKRSKTGKRFAFVRFIKVTNIDRLVDNLCTIWIGRFHIHANIVRFQRAQRPTYDQSVKHYVETSKTSFASVLKEGNPKNGSSTPPPVSSKPALVLDDSCLLERDFSKDLMGKVKDVNSIPNLPFIFSK
ncbi:RNA-directed DNA polymerase, eukaryota, nucleotide-binding alpha-beta plait domain protein [Tanacetum coccineum]